MKRTITLFAFMFFSLSLFGCISHNGENVSESDSTAVQRMVAELRDSLNNRNFSEDMATLRVKAEQLGNKTKEVIEGHTHVVKELIHSIADYLKRQINYNNYVKYKSMRPEKYGMYYWYNDEDKKSYDILMMYTEKSIGGRNSNIFLKTLYDKFKSEYPNEAVRLGDYAYQEDGNVIELQCVGKKAYYKDAEFIIEDIENPEDKQAISIEQDNGVDTQDRIEIAWIAIDKLIKSSCKAITQTRY